MTSTNNEVSRQLEHLVQEGYAFMGKNNLTTAFDRFTAAANIAVQCRHYFWLVTAQRQQALCRQQEGNIAAAVEFMGRALAAADAFVFASNKEQLAISEPLYQEIMDAFQLLDARHKEPELFAKFDEAEALVDDGANEEEFGPSVAERYEQAQQVCEELLELTIEKFGYDHWLVASALCIQARCQDEIDTRRQLLTRAANIAADWGPPNGDLRQMVLADLMELDEF